MLRDLFERAARLGRKRTTDTKKKLPKEFRRSRQRRGRLQPIYVPYFRLVEGKPASRLMSFRTRWIPNPEIERFHGSWWTRLRVRTGVAGRAVQQLTEAQA